MKRIHALKVIDLTKPLDGLLDIYHSRDYSDPPFRCSEWCSVEEQGFCVSRLELGTQTGTHIDAPAHFTSDGATLESLPVDRLMGAYFLVDLPDRCDLESIRKLSAGYSQEPILFLRTNRSGVSRLLVAALNALIELPPEIWVVAGMIEVAHAPSLEFHRTVALAGKFLIEDLLETAAALVPRRGEIFALPLRLIGTSGAPCRVVVREAAGLGETNGVGVIFG
jgi:arylformamidase